MRITGGRYGGRIVRCPPGVIRPTMDRMRESMFSILGPLNGLSFLDLFAGSGVVALESLSRGANSILLVEKDRKKRKTILENLKIARDDPENPRVKLVIKAVEHLLHPGMDRFDIVHCDPPFAMHNKLALLKLAELAKQPAKGGTLMIHYPAEDDFPEEIGRLRLYDKRSYGASRLSFYSRDD